MIEKLAHEGRAGRVIGVVGVVGTELGLGDQPDRSDFERVVGIENAAASPERGEHDAKLVVGFSKGRMLGEHPHEPVRTIDREAGRDIRAVALSASITPASPAVAATLGDGDRWDTERGTACGKSAEQGSPRDLLA